MKKVVIGGVVTIAVAVVAVGFGFSFFVSSKIDEILTQSIEVEGVNFQSGQVVTSMGFLETRKIIRNSKLTLNESSFSLPEISISVDTSQALINIPNVEGELSDGTKLKGTGVVLSTPASTVLFTPASSSIDSFQADFEVANLVATRDELQASAKLLKGDVSKTDKSISSIISVSKLTLNEASFSLPEISISVDTSQALINIPNVEGELPDGTKLKGTDAVLSIPASSSIDRFQAD